MSIFSIGYGQKQAQSQLCVVATYGTRFGEGRIATKRRAPFHPENCLDPETALWRAVVLRAMKDAAGLIDTSHVKTQKAIENVIRNAQGWFRGNSEGFRSICDAAGFDPDYVRGKALARFKLMPKKKMPPRKMTFKRKLAA